MRIYITDIWDDRIYRGIVEIEFYFRRAILVFVGRINYGGPNSIRTWQPPMLQMLTYSEASVMKGLSNSWRIRPSSVVSQSGPFDFLHGNGGAISPTLRHFARRRHRQDLAGQRLGWQRYGHRCRMGWIAVAFGGRGIVASAGASCKVDESQYCGYLSDTWSYNTVNNVWTQQGGGEAQIKGGFATTVRQCRLTKPRTEWARLPGLPTR